MLQRAFLGSFAAIAIALAPALTTRADPLPLTRTPSLGSPRRPVRIGLVSGERLALFTGGERHILPARHARDASIEEIVSGVDGAVALIRVTAEDGRWVGLVGGRAGTRLLLFEPADPRGDPGERRHLEVVRDSGVRVYERHERASLCGDRPAPFAARAIDPRTLTLVDAAAPPPPVSTRSVTAVETGEREPPPVLAGLTAIASSQRDAATGSPTAPHALLADDGPGIAAAAGSFAQLRWEGRGQPIERLSLEVAVRGAAPLRLWWLGDTSEALVVTLAPKSGSTRYVITPPAPIASRCLALYVEQAGAPPPVLRGLRAYTALDRPGGIDALIAQLVQDDARGADAAALLAQLGPEAARRLAARWESLSPRGQRRGLTVLARALADEGVRARVIATARSDDADLREAAIALLARGGPAAALGLAQLARAPSAAGDAAARALAGLPEGTPGLLAALAVEGGEARPVLREALSAAARRAPTAFDAACTAWLRGRPSVAARAALALAAARGGREETAAMVAAEALDEATGFDDRHRLALALAGAAPEPRAAAWLAREAAQAPEWMQRRAAFEALARGGDRDTVVRIGLALTRDAYPRVRASVLGRLVARGEAEPAAELGARDPWPLVRAAAMRALGPHPGGRAALERGLDDPAPSVREAAIGALAAQRPPPAWPRIAARLTAADEATTVKLAAIAFARDTCSADAREALLQTARTLLSADASEAETTVALEALRALAALGGAAREAGADLVREAGEPALKALWAKLPPARCARTDA